MTGTSSTYWLNLQNMYDVLITEFKGPFGDILLQTTLT